MIGNKTRAVTATLLFAFAGLAIAGCELIVDFDRTKIDAGAGDATVSDAPADITPPPVDSGQDAADAGKDAVGDAPVDVAQDTGSDASGDDAGGSDAGDDASDAAAD